MGKVSIYKIKKTEGIGTLLNLIFSKFVSVNARVWYPDLGLRQ
jgi:hypothetical protein